MPICRLMWDYCSLHCGSAWELVATWEWYVAWSDTHCFAARLTTKCSIVRCRSRLASGQLMQNKLISACKRFCRLYRFNPTQALLISFWHQTLPVAQMHLSLLSNGFRYLFGLHPSSLENFIPLDLCRCVFEEGWTYFCFTPAGTFLFTSPQLLLKISLSEQNVKFEFVQGRKV